jgi:hypothetical protein
MSIHDPYVFDLDRLIAVARGEAEVEEGDKEHRKMRRCRMDGQLAFVQTTNTGGKSIATTVQCRDIGPGGIGITCRHMLHVGYEGAVLMPRPKRVHTIVGVKVTHCRYVGDMCHEAGLIFTGALPNFEIDDFRDEQGNLPRLTECRRAA